MKILGITNNDLSGACLVAGGRIIAAASEERFTRVKNEARWPASAIDYVLTQAGLRLDQVDRIAYGWSAGFDAEKHLPLYFDRIATEARLNPAGLALFRQRIIDEIGNDRAKRQELKDFVAAHGMDGRVDYLDHHQCHALGAFVCSPFDEALVLTCDGRGDFQSLTLSHYQASGHAVLQRETSIDSIGYFYGRITALLGYKPNRHEGKITGLAAFGDAERLLPLMRSMICFEDGRVRALCGDYFQASYQGYSDNLLRRLAGEKAEDVAAAAQRHSEDLLVAVLRQHLPRGAGGQVCLAGGVFGNVKLNQRIREIPEVRNVYVLPCMGDCGLALAAATGSAYLREGLRFPLPSMHLGPDAGETGANLALMARQYPEFSQARPADMIASVTQALAHNQVIGMYKGRMEFGPRALCNRSIIYHAADRKANDWLNQRMRRTEFMPFAPITAVEHAADCYIDWRDDHIAADYMTMTYDCHELIKQRCPAVVHVDGTARPQIVRAPADPFMHKLLLAWERRTGQPALINTSFNKHEEPIICDARDAFEALRAGMVDLLAMNEEVLIWKTADSAASAAIQA